MSLIGFSILLRLKICQKTENEPWQPSFCHVLFLQPTHEPTRLVVCFVLPEDEPGQPGAVN